MPENPDPQPAAGCPAGYREGPDTFLRDGKKSVACVAKPELKKEACIDVLYPGESMKLTVPIPTPAAKENPVVRQ